MRVFPPCVVGCLAAWRHRYVATAVAVAVSFFLSSPAWSGPITIETSTWSRLAANAGSGFYADGPALGDSESYAELPATGGGKWFSSALAEQTGNLEVGVSADRTLLRGRADAFANISFSQEYLSGSKIGGIEFIVQPGEILLTTPTNIQPALGTHTAFLGVNLSARINKVLVNEYAFFLELTSTNGGFDIDPSSSGTALIHLNEVLSGGGGIWGVRTEGFKDVLVLPLPEPGDMLDIVYSMQAMGEARGLVDTGLGFSVKIGDPLDGQGNGLLVLPPDENLPGVSVSEPGVGWLLMLVLVCVAATAGVARRSRRNPFASPIH